ncbi:hypothetical protein, partial [Phocaeicola vulgatus]|uniref:hypothetical protein n=1 Tax=Phocaeicola vulgatus TaxID=821 RepID=UPI001E5B685E
PFVFHNTIEYCFHDTKIRRDNPPYNGKSYIMMKNDTILGDYSCGSGCDKCDYLGERLERK